MTDVKQSLTRLLINNDSQGQHQHPASNNWTLLQQGIVTAASGLVSVVQGLEMIDRACPAQSLPQDEPYRR